MMTPTERFAPIFAGSAAIYRDAAEVSFESDGIYSDSAAVLAKGVPFIGATLTFMVSDAERVPR
eukprot:3115027-Rhodomonas_salina.2